MSGNVEPSIKRARRSKVSTDWSTVFLTELLPIVDDRVHHRDLIRDVFLECLREADVDLEQKVVDNMTALIDEIADNYNVTPYHNLMHAIHVFLNCHVLLHQSLVRWTPVEKFALLFSAIIHDLGHEGVPNAQLVKEKHPLALKYENQSVAENYSIDKGLQLLYGLDEEGGDNGKAHGDTEGATTQEEGESNGSPFPNFVGSLFTSKDHERLKELVKSIVLATDITNKERVQSIYNDISAAIATHANSFKKSDSSTKSGDDGSSVWSMDLDDKDNRSVLLCLYMKLADVGGTFQHVNTSKYWIHNFYDENMKAHRDNRGDAVESEGFLKGQQGFWNSYIRHLISIVESTGSLTEVVLNTMRNNLDNLTDMWSQECDDLLTRWCEKWQ